MQPEEKTSPNNLRQSECIFSRVAFILFLMSPLLFTEILQNFYSLISASVYGIYFFISCLLCFLTFSEKAIVHKITYFVDAFLIGNLCWLTGALDYSVLAFAILVISINVDNKQNILSSALLLAICTGIASWHFLPNLNVHPLQYWSGSWQSFLSISSFTIFVLFFVNRQFILQEESHSRFNMLETRHRDLKLKLYQVSKYISPSLRKKLSHAKEVEAKTVRKKLTIFFSDLVGFSEIVEEMDPADLNDVLNSYVTEMSSIAIKHGATIDKFMGDGMMAFFGDPKSNGTKEDAIKCVAMAIEMRQKMQKLRHKWREQGIKADLHIRMGINSGFTTVGNFGSNDRLDYTAVGTEVNLASRLETSADVDGILVSSSTQLLIGDKYLTENRGDIRVKGFADPIPVFKIIGDRATDAKSLAYANHNLDGFSLYMDLDSMPNYNRKKAHNALVDAAQKLKKYTKS